MYYLYILQSKIKDKFYIGYSSDPWKRLIEHNTVPHLTFTSKYRPWELAVVFEVGNSKKKATSIERFIKKQKSISLINKLIDPRFKPTGILAQLVRVPHVRD